MKLWSYCCHGPCKHAFVEGISEELIAAANDKKSQQLKIFQLTGFFSLWYSICFYSWTKDSSQQKIWLHEIALKKKKKSNAELSNTEILATTVTSNGGTRPKCLPPWSTGAELWQFSKRDHTTPRSSREWRYPKDLLHYSSWYMQTLGSHKSVAVIAFC